MLSMDNVQSTKESIDQMGTYPEYQKANDDLDVISVVKIIRKICYRYDCNLHKSQAILFSLKKASLTVYSMAYLTSMIGKR